jgi:hypothetical protein
MYSNPNRSLPTPTEWDKEYWDGARDGKLLIQICSDCKNVTGLPKVMCPHCSSFNIEWIEASGAATIYSWTVLRRSFHPRFDDVPFIIAIVELTDHPEVHLASNICNPTADELSSQSTDVKAQSRLHIGAPVKVTFHEFGGMTLPLFEFVDEESLENSEK